MIESLQLIQKEIEIVLDQISANHPLREHLIKANKECDILITNEKIDYYESEYYLDYED